MKILVVGGGGREHTIVWKIAQSDKVSKIYCAPGNGGISQLAECVDIPATDIDSMVRFAKEKEIDLVMVAPDDPLVMGMVDAMEKEGIRAMLYTHPIGFYGHAAGPSFGMYDNQGFVPGHGELKLNDDTCYALELNVTEYVPEWGQDVRFMMEETISFTGGETYFNDDYRDQIILVK